MAILVSMPCARPAVELDPAGGIQLQRHVAAVVQNLVLPDILLPENAGVGGSKQFLPGRVLQSQPLPGKEVHIPDAHPLEVGRLVQLDECRQRLVQVVGEILPAGVAQSGQGDEILGEV